MATFRKKIKFEYSNEYDLPKKQYTGPYIYDAGGDLNKRWYVYFGFRNPLTGKIERQPYIDIGVNTEKTLPGRNKAVARLHKIVEEELKNGYSPFETNSGFVENSTAKTYSINDAVVHVLKIKKKTLKGSSYSSFSSRIKSFEQWLYGHGFTDKAFQDVNKHTINNYLNEVLDRTSARNRNNVRGELSAFWTEMVNESIVRDNFFSEISKKDTTSKRNKSFMASLENEILEYVEQQNPLLFTYILFVSYNLLRPVEVSRLQIGEIDMVNRKIQFQAKNQDAKVKIIPEIMARYIPDLSSFDRSMWLFGHNEFGGYWSDDEKYRQNHYSKMFLEVKKHFGLGREYGFYSFRHTAISRLMNNLLKDFTYFEAESRAMLITGHGSVKAFRTYLRSVDAQLPEDYSKYIK